MCCNRQRENSPVKHIIMFEFEKKTRNAHDGPFRCPLLQILLTLINPQGWLIVLKGLLTWFVVLKIMSFRLKIAITAHRTEQTRPNPQPQGLLSGPSSNSSLQDIIRGTSWLRGTEESSDNRERRLEPHPPSSCRLRILLDPWRLTQEHDSTHGWGSATTGSVQLG